MQDAIMPNYGKRRDKSGRISRRQCYISADFCRSIIGEFLCTFFFMIIVCVVDLKWEKCEGTSPTATDTQCTKPATNTLKIAFTLGFAVTTLIQCFEQISGAHMNPAITVAMMLVRHTGIVKGILYIIAQAVGAATAILLMQGFLPADLRGSMGFQVWSDDVTAHQALGVEFIQVFLLVFTILSSLDPRRHLAGLVALPVGVTFLMNTLWAYEFTGASMNPVRTLSSAILLGNNGKEWAYIIEIYVAGPMIGAVLAGLVYKYIFDPNTGTSSSRSDNSSFYDSDEHMVALQTVSSFNPDESRA